MSEKNSNRRSFLKFSVLGAAALPLLKFTKAHAAPAAAAKPMADPKEGVAKSLGYVTKSVAKPQADGVKTQCHSCMLYKNPTGAGAAEKGDCLVIPGKLVMAEGWCNSYARNQAVKK